MTEAPLPEPGLVPVEAEVASRVARLFERHGRMVYGVCRVMLRDVPDAEDATQQVFLSAHRALLGGADVRNPGAWLATIARNESRGRIAAGMWRPLSLVDEDLDALPSTVDEHERRAQARELRSALAELPARQREAVVLRYVYGLRYGEVATALGLSRPATEAVLFRARRALRLRLRSFAGAALVIPLAVREELALAIPGFTTSPASSAAAAGATGGLLAQLTAGPVGAKMATAAVAVSTVGAAGAVESDRGGRDRAERPALAASVRPQADDASGPRRSGILFDADVDTHREGRSSGADGSSTEDRSGPGPADDSGREPSATRGSGTDGSGEAGSGGEPSDDRSGPGGHDRDPPAAAEDDPAAHQAEPDDDPTASSSGPGSGEDPEDDSSGHGSGNNGSGGGSSGSSGSGHGGSSDDIPDA